MNLSLRALRRPALAVAALAVATFSLLPALAGHAYAYGQVTSRSIKISSSQAGATGQTYTFTFNTATAGAIHGIVLNFCDDNPLIGNSCSWTSGQSIVVTSATLTSVSDPADSTVGASNWQLSANANSASAGNGVILALTDSSVASNTSVASNSTITIVVAGITNPNYTTCGSPDTHPNCSFYGRMLTYSTTAGATGYASQTIGSPTDAGGVALETSSVINITANVMEQLTFCVSANVALANGTNRCNSGGGVLTAPNLTIGHGTPTSAIDSTAVDAQTAYTQLSTNASVGFVVRMKTSYASCAGLSKDGGTTCGIPPAGSGTTDGLITAGTAAFGMCVVAGANTTPDAPYNGVGAGSVACADTTTPNANTYYGMDNTGGTGVFGTYGSQIFHNTSSPAAVDKENNKLNFAATASLTTPAGIYQTTESLIATGTF